MKKPVFQSFLVVWFLTWVAGGCASFQDKSPKVSYRMTEVVDGDSVFVVTINKAKFVHQSSDGGLDLFLNKEKNIVRIRVGKDTRGTYVGGDIDHYYFVDEDGDVTYLGNLKASWWFKDEKFYRFEPTGFKAIADAHDHK
jgi:hypothetical protein